MKSRAIPGIVLFREEQNFRRAWLVIAFCCFLAVILAIVFYGTYKQLHLGLPFGNNPMSDAGLLIFNTFLVVFSGAAVVLLNSIELVVRLDRDNLLITFHPLVNNKTIPLSEIESCEAVTYRPIRDYGGWGLRYSLKGKNWAYSVGGDRGVMLTFKDGKKLLLGSRRAEEMVEAVKRAKGVS